MSDIADDTLAAAVLAALAEISKPEYPDLVADDITIGRMCNMLGCGKDKAERTIRDLLAAGKLVPVNGADAKRRNPETGKDVLAWRLTK